MSLNMDQQHGTTSQNYYLYKSKYGGLVQRVHPFLGRENYRSAAATYIAGARPPRRTGAAEVLRRRAVRT